MYDCRLGEFGYNLRETWVKMDAMCGKVMQLRADVDALHNNQEHLRKELNFLKLHVMSIEHQRQGERTIVKDLGTEMKGILRGMNVGIT